MGTKSRRMTTQDADERLLEYIQLHGSARVEDLADELDRSASSIRRDLQRLALDGKIIRSYGGATLNDGTSARRAPEHAEERRRIGRAAAELVKDGQTVAITGGRTTLELARAIAKRENLTVITNSLDIAQELVDSEGIQLVVLGGVARPGHRVLLGHLTEMAAQELRADTLFIGIGAIDPDLGLMNDFLPDIATDRVLKSIAGGVVVLADGSKFSSVAPAAVFGFDDVAAIVTDSGVDETVLERIRARGTQVIVAE